MLKTFFYMIFLVIVFPFSYLSAAVPLLFFRLAGRKESVHRTVRSVSGLFSRVFIRATGTSVAVENPEKLPEDSSRLCFVANHQSYFDILIIRGYIPVLAGFLAKKELERIPVLRNWMHEFGCVFIDRSSPRAAVEAIEKGVESIRSGHPIVLFPEGTRSKSQIMGQFKPGGLKLALRSKAVIVPLSIVNASKMYEESGGVSSADVKIVIHDPVDTADLGDQDSKQLSDRLWSIINSGLR